MNKHMVLYQKQILVERNGPPAKTVSVFKLQASSLEEAIKQVRYNFTPWVIAFKELPSTNTLISACEEAIQNNRGQQLPLAIKPHNVSELAKRIGLSIHGRRKNAV